MSKKMMKRSLALGALMAFVITGSAMAAEKTVGISNNTTHKNKDAAYVFVQNSELLELGSPTYSVSGNGIHITGAQPGEAINNNGVADLHAGLLTINTTDGGNGIYTVYGGQLTLGVDDGLYITSSGHGINSGTSANSAITINAEKTMVSIDAAENAIDSRGNGTKIELNANDVIVTSTNTGDTDADWKGYAVISRAEGSRVEINATGDVDITSKRTAVYANKGSISVIGKTIDIIAGEGAGVRAGTSASDAVRGNGNVVLGNDNTEGITIEGTMDYGIIARAKNNTGNADVQSSVVVNGESLVIGAKEGSEIYAGICAASGTEAESGYNSSSVTVNTGYTEINADYGLYNMSNGNVTVNGDLTINANESAIITRGYADTVINGNNDENITVKINGDIEFNKYYDNNSSVTDSNVVINLANADSFLNGNIIVTNADRVAEANKATINEITGMKLALSNGATWKLSEASVVNEVSFTDNAVLALKDGSVFEKQAVESNDVYALNAGGGTNSLTVDNTAKLQIGNIKETTYNIAKGFAEPGEKWILDDALMELDVAKGNGGWIYTGNNLQVAVKAKEASEIAEKTGMSQDTAGLVAGIIEGNKGDNNTPAQQAAVDFITNANNNNTTPEAVGAAINAATKMAEAGGNNATAANIVKNVTGVTNDRLSFNCGHSAPHKGGHGVGLFEEGSGADIWVEYVHGKDKVEDMPSTAGATSYEGQFNGFVMGVDFKKVNKFQSGVAFNYGEGDTNSVGGVARTHSDYDFWGVGYYGNIHNDDSNVIFDINYAKTDSDVTQNNSGTVFEASPETTTWSAGVKLEKLYQNENVQIVPYTGLRYMSIDSDDYSTKCGAFNYSMDRQDIWLLPLGVSIRQEIANDNGWTVSPRVDLSYIWAFGDTNSNMEVKSPFSGVSQLGYDVMDDGSFLGLVGIEAHKGQWGYGVSYSYQKGDHSESKKWFVDVNYSF